MLSTNHYVATLDEGDLTPTTSTTCANMLWICIVIKQLDRYAWCFTIDIYRLLLLCSLLSIVVCLPSTNYRGNMLCVIFLRLLYFFCDASATCMKQLQNLYYAFSGDEIFKLKNC